MPCIICGGTPSPHTFGIRLRKPGQRDAIWAQDTTAEFCDNCARNGYRVTVVFEPLPAAEIESHVSLAGGPDHHRLTPINPIRMP